MFEKIVRHISQNRSWALEVMARLTSLPAIGPDNQGQGEWAKAQYLLSLLEPWGMNIMRVDAPDNRVPDQLRPNLLAWWGDKAPGCFVLSHMDVVPVGSLELWNSDPWKLEVNGPLLYGRGVSDNHDGIVSSLLALKTLTHLGLPLPGRAGVTLVSDEETGSHLGLEYVLKTKPDFFKSSDLIIIPDAGRPNGDFIEVAEKSILWLKVEVLGRQAHASTPEAGRNALYAAARMMTEIYRVRDSFTQRMDLFSPPISTMEPTRKEEGVENINTIPGRDVFYIDCRLLPGIALNEVEDSFRAVFGGIAKELGVSFNITRKQALTAPPGTPADAPVVRALKNAIKQTRNIEAEVGGVGGGTVAAFCRQRGLAAAVWNSNSNNAHMPNECANVEDICRDAQVFALIYAGLAR
jgi:succinyl-diaminopimelate desuccinylase